MLEDNYTITDLEKKTGLNRRTIHFYTKEKMIPPPYGAGGGARYGEEHVVRLRLIQELQKSHLRLSGIREALDSMSLDEMREVLAKARLSPPEPWSKETLEQWLQGEGYTEDITPEPGMPSPPGPMSANYSFLDMAKGEKEKIKKTEAKEFNELREARSESILPPRPEDKSYLKSLKRTVPRGRDTWERLTIAEGLEIHIRSDMVERYQALMPRMMILIKELLSR
ncbi:MAG: helix-turn-helix domain-containing protein [bacterium]